MGEIKESFDTDRVVLGNIFPLDTPFTVILDSSEICNLRCNYCFRSDDDKKKWGHVAGQKTMDWDVFAKAVEKIKEFPNEVRQISLSHHGEPLTNRMVPRMATYIKERGLKCRVSIHTNATLLDKEYAAKLAESKIDRVVISIQGLNGDKYKEKCGVAVDFNKLYESLQYFYMVKTNTQLYIKVANTALEEGEEERFYELFRPISDRVFIEQIIPLWSEVDIKDVNDKVQNKYGQSFERQYCCPLIFHTIVVLPNGDVYPCTQLLSEDKLGNIEKESLMQCWNSEYRRGLLVNCLKMEKNDICKDCAILNNSIYAKEDMIDGFREQILARIGFPLQRTE